MQTIGEICDHAIETKVLSIENDISTRPFSEQVLACFPPFPWTLQPEDLSNPLREDLRHLRVFSMDPPRCKNINDALCCRALPNGNFEVGVSYHHAIP